MQFGAKLGSNTAGNNAVSDTNFWRGTHFWLSLCLASNASGQAKISEANKAKIRSAISSAKTPDELQEHLERAKAEILSQNDPTKLSAIRKPESSPASLESRAALSLAAQNLAGSRPVISASASSAASADAKELKSAGNANQLSSKTDAIKQVVSVIESLFKKGQEDPDSFQLELRFFDNDQNLQLKCCMPTRGTNLNRVLKREFKKIFLVEQKLDTSLDSYNSALISTTKIYSGTIESLTKFLTYAEHLLSATITRLIDRDEDTAKKQFKKYSEIFQEVQSALSIIDQVALAPRDNVARLVC